MDGFRGDIGGRQPKRQRDAALRATFSGRRQGARAGEPPRHHRAGQRLRQAAQRPPGQRDGSDRQALPHPDHALGEHGGHADPGQSPRPLRTALPLRVVRDGMSVPGSRRSSRRRRGRPDRRSNGIRSPGDVRSMRNGGVPATPAREASGRWQGPLHGADDAPLEVELAALVVAREVVRDLNALHRRVDDLPPLRSVGVRMPIRFVDDNLQGFIRHADEGGFPPRWGPFAVGRHPGSGHRRRCAHKAVPYAAATPEK